MRKQNSAKEMGETKIFLIVVGVVAVILLGYYALQADQTETITEEETEIEKQIDETIGSFIPIPREWPTSGPFEIDKSQYLLGENIFVRITNLAQNEKGQIAFLRPLNETHYSVYITIPFDGAEKNSFNSYFTPDLSRALKICTVDDLIGTWKIVFQKTNYENISFKILNKTLPGEEDYYISVC